GGEVPGVLVDSRLPDLAHHPINTSPGFINRSHAPVGCRPWRFHSTADGDGRFSPCAGGLRGGVSFLGAREFVGHVDEHPRARGVTCFGGGLKLNRASTRGKNKACTYPTSENSPRPAAAGVSQ